MVFQIEAFVYFQDISAGLFRTMALYRVFLKAMGRVERKFYYPLAMLVRCSNYTKQKVGAIFTRRDSQSMRWIKRVALGLKAATYL